jgi:hypothetical protein
MSDWDKRPGLDKMLKIVCKQFRNLAIEYNHTPRYAVAEYWDGINDILSDFKESHVAKMLRDLDLMMYWDIFEKREGVYFENYALDSGLFENLQNMGIMNVDHIEKMMKYFRSGRYAGEGKNLKRLRSLSKKDEAYKRLRIENEIVEKLKEKKAVAHEKQIYDLVKMLVEWGLESETSWLVGLGVQCIDDLKFLNEDDVKDHNPKLKDLIEMIKERM